VFTDILQPTHLLFVLVIALLVLGPKRLPEVGRSLGRGLRDFRGALSGEEADHREEVPMQTATATQTPVPEPVTTTPTPVHEPADATATPSAEATTPVDGTADGTTPVSTSADSTAGPR
jgi:sec-independent protein translocase protein TatA